MSQLLSYFKHFLADHHIPYSHDLWLDFGDWFYDSYGKNNISDLNAVDLWFSHNTEYLINKAKDDYLKTWRSVCASCTKASYDEAQAAALFDEYFQLYVLTPKASSDDGLNRFQRMKQFLSLHKH
jgi:hypothetical protein